MKAQNIDVTDFEEKLESFKTDIRSQAEKELIKSHLRLLQAPVGVNPVLKCWMEIN